MSPCKVLGTRDVHKMEPATSTHKTRDVHVILMLVLHLSDVYVAGFMRGRRRLQFVDVTDTKNLTWGHRFLPAMCVMCFIKINLDTGM